jgi:glutaminyl-peptide cyclotransferase
MLLLAGCPAKEQKSAPSPVPEQATQGSGRTPVPTVDGDRAFSFLVTQTSFGPRNPGSRGHQECLRYLTEELGNAADRVTTQEFTHQGYGGEVLRLTNILASFRPDVQRRILLCAHWDTRPRAEQDDSLALRDRPIIGANDGASGVAVLLELAHLFKEFPPPVGVDIVFFDGEDYGKEGDLPRYLLGSRHYAASAERTTVPEFGILLDMVGDAFLTIPREANSVRLAPDVVDRVWNTARTLGIQEFADVAGPEIYDDHLPLNDAGIKTIDLIDFAYPDEGHRYWHTHQDIPEHCSAQSLAAVGTVLAGVIYGPGH